MTPQATSAPWQAVAGPGARTTDAREVDRFTEALQPRLMGPRLSAALGSGRQVCHVLDAKYEPGLRAVVLYQHGDDLVRGDLVATFDTAGPRRTTTAPGLRVSVFPHDHELPTLPRMMDAARVGPLLADAIPAEAPDRNAALARRCGVQLLRYRPGKRATLRVTSRPRGDSYVAKVYHQPVKAAAVATEARALTAMTTPNGTLRFASTLAYIPELSLVVQQAVHGRSLDGLLGGRVPEAADAVRRAARALAELHGGPVVSARARPVEREIRRFAVRAKRIATVDEHLGARLLSLAERLRDTYGELATGPVGLVHGDCKPSQFLLDGPHVYLLDLDHCGVTDQASDVGTFVASLRQLAVRQALTGGYRARPANWAALGSLFVEAYLTGKQDAGLPTRIRWHEAAALERKALRAFARAPRSPLPAALVAEGHRCLDTTTRGLG